MRDGADRGSGYGVGTIAAAARLQTREAERSVLFRWLVRTGFVARGITYGLIGALAVAIALGAGSAGVPPNQQGALALIARAGIGRAALVLISAGLLAYAIWKLTQGASGRGPEGGGGTGLKDRVANIGGGIVYLGFLGVAVQALARSAGDSSKAPKEAAAGVLGWPGGPLIVGIGAAVLIAISLYQLYEALSGKFADQSKTGEMDSPERGLFFALGRVGLSARALVFALIGYFLLRTAIEFNANNAVGVDGALEQLRHQPLGQWLVGAAGAGLLTFAVFSLLEARHRRL